MKKTLTITTHQDQSEADKAYWRQRTPEERLDAVELLRQEAGKFLYECPARLRRVLEVRSILNKSSTLRVKDKADVEELT